MRATTAVVLALALSPISIGAQVLHPIPRYSATDGLPDFSFLGEGAVQRNRDAPGLDPFDNPLARFVIAAYPAQRLHLFLVGNKGIQNTDANADFEVGSLAFPDASKSGFLANASYVVPLYTHSLTRTMELPLFIEFAHHGREVFRSDSTFSFDATTWYFGGRFQWTVAGADERFRISLMPSYAILQVSDGSLPEFRQAVRDPEHPDVFRGPAIKAGVQFNDFSYEFSFVRFSANNGASVSGLTDGRFSVRISATGKLFDKRF